MAALHTNLLARIDRELGANIDVANFRHEARVLDGPPRVEAHLVARSPATYRVGEERIDFAAGESIHTDTSFKYDADTFADLARQAGWEPMRRWHDPGGMMCLHLLRA
jgi:uncharacterized SAM-dependent methyltransferase